jgi:hypothetical protein
MLKSAAFVPEIPYDSLPVSGAPTGFVMVKVARPVPDWTTFPKE